MSGSPFPVCWLCVAALGLLAASPPAAGAAGVTFNRHVAPILYRHCAPCHRPGQSAPFPLLAYADAAKRGQLIVEVTERRYMPPWLPAAGFGEFLDPRVLAGNEIGILRQWLAEGLKEGKPGDAPAPPEWNGEWQLGRPDLIVQAPAVYRLAADGRDVYRNFVIPIPVAAKRYVAAVEFRPGNRVVHHAAMRIDRTAYSRRIDAQDPEPGFGGMTLPESTDLPGGHFLNWQPGKLPYRAPTGLAWTLEIGTDLVAQLHLRPSGKPEEVQPRIGFYFTDETPTRECFKVILDSTRIDIPPGRDDFTIQESYELPVDVDLLTIFPHAHYLARRMESYAVLPDGRREWLLLIPQWDFNWQGDYRYARPVYLPRSTVVHMRFTYDNTRSNVRNPFQPPQHVQFGPQTTDEMGELWLQLLPRNPADLPRLKQHYTDYELRKTVHNSEFWARLKPADAKIRLQWGKASLALGRFAEAGEQLRRAAELEPQYDQPHYFLGLSFRLQKQVNSAKTEFETALRLNPQNYRAHGNLGFIFSEEGNLERAEFHLREALRINPDDALAREILEQIRPGKGP